MRSLKARQSVFATETPTASRVPTPRPRSRRVARPLLIGSLILGGCVEDIYADSLMEFPKTSTDTSSGTTLEDTPTTSASGEDPDVHTATSSPGETTELPNTDNPPPVITQFFAEPNPLSQAGVAQLHLVTSDDVIKATLHREDDPQDPDYPKSLTLADFPFAIQAFSASDNATHEYKVVVEDPEGQTANATTLLTIALPATGATKCVFEDKDLGALTSVITAVAYLDDAIVAVGSRDIGSGLELSVWKFDLDCGLLPTWPKTLSNWTAKKPLTLHDSHGAALALAPDGTLLVGGNLDVNGQPQSYVAGLTPEGTRIWEQEGLVGDELTGIAPAKAQFSDRLFVVGARKSDAAIWTYQITGAIAFIPPAILLKAPFTDAESDDVNNKLFERANAVVVDPATGLALVVGERELVDNLMVVRSRTFTARVHPLGGLMDAPWTSPAPALLHDSIHSVTLCGDRLVAGGWTRDDIVPDAKPMPLLFWLDGDGEVIQHRSEPDLLSAHILGVACDAQQKIFSAATRTLGQSDALAYSVPGPLGARVAFETGMSEPDGAGAAACNSLGFCAWGGFRTINGKSVAVVSAHNP